MKNQQRQQAVNIDSKTALFAVSSTSGPAVNGVQEVFRRTASANFTWICPWDEDSPASRLCTCASSQLGTRKAEHVSSTSGPAVNGVQEVFRRTASANFTWICPWDEDSPASRLCTCASSQLGTRKAEHVSSTSGPAVNGVQEVFRRTASANFTWICPWDEDSPASRLCTCASSQLGTRKAEHVSSTSGPAVNGVQEVFRRTASANFTWICPWDEDSPASRLCTCASSQLGTRKAEHGDPPTT
ncbi:uncharacterized protein LOC142783986 [Rhipicephalus microplus]|uniref:uncharacterized protein LOC142783986 n=1 Tax=Rhipicephalus microplus TaxID=6941 RepID=UPI003F6B0429